MTIPDISPVIMGDNVWIAPGTRIKRVPLLRGGEPIRRTYCAFWKKDNTNPYTASFAAMLQDQFT